MIGKDLGRAVAVVPDFFNRTKPLLERLVFGRRTGVAIRAFHHEGLVSAEE